MSRRGSFQSRGRNFSSTFSTRPGSVGTFERMGLDINKSDDKDDLPNVKTLKFVDIELNEAENVEKHHCNDYEITHPVEDYSIRQTRRLVVRRGQSFDITIRFNRPYNKDTDKVFMQFSMGERPKIPKKTMVRLPIHTPGDENKWTANLQFTNGNEMTVTITTPKSCYVGIWRMRGIITYSNNLSILSKKKDVYILFNPFNKDDDVYMSDEQERQEYVLNDYGVIYMGTSQRISKRNWNFGQFQGHVLDCAMYLLDKSQMPYTDRGNPVHVSRRLSAMVNSQDDDGVIAGNWSGNYEGSKSPLDWQGSEQILEQYWETKSKVKFGQCWVFSGILTTACRALGIPCRSVTNFNSATGTDSSVTIDRFYNELNELDEFMTEDSVWNFHVWNEAYMSRPDLPEKHYGGWQAIDATPQETSNVEHYGFGKVINRENNKRQKSVYCGGPAPVRAIKNGDTGVNYDVPFVFAEVNSDVVHHTRQKYKEFRLRSDEIGRNISTKSVLKPERNDITNEYKFAEGTAAERAAVMRAVRSDTKGGVFHTGRNDIKIEVMIDPTINIGSDFHAKIKIENTSNETRIIRGNISVMTVYYTGVLAHTLINRPVMREIPAASSETLETSLTYDEYASKLMDHCSINLTCLFLVDETDQPFYYNQSYALEKPELQIKAPSNGKVRETFDVEVSFKNPLKVSLTACVLRVEGPGFTKGLHLGQNDIDPGETFLTSIMLTPRLKGCRTIYLNFSCDQIMGINGSHFINIEKF